MRARLLLAAAGLALMAQMAAGQPLKTAADTLCGPLPLPDDAAAAALGGAWLQEIEETRRGRVRHFLMADGSVLIENRFAPGGTLRRLTLERHVNATPLTMAIIDGDCVIRSGRRLVWRDGRAVALDQLDADLETVMWTETLEAPWPPGRDPGGPRIALVDSGLAYDIAPFPDHLARDAAGQPLGFDYWDEDRFPYDGNFTRGPFFPIRHGTAVASIIVAEAPDAALIPYRYPRPDMTRMGAIVEAADKAGARILAMPLGSNDPAEWETFAAALAARPDMLAIVSSGNDGRDLDAEPLWPASLDLDNIIVVGSADIFGRLAPGGSWGGETVDLLVPAENRPVIDFRGSEQRASGSSYAVPRVAALAARVLAERPDLSGPALRAALFARAIPADGVRVGFIPAPQD